MTSNKKKISNEVISLIGKPGPWFYLDPDYRRERPDSPHCCRCGKPMKGPGSFIVVEVDWDNIGVRNNPLGKEIIGSDCWEQVQKEPLNDNQNKTLTVQEAVEAVKSMGIAESHKEELKREYQRGYNQAIEDMKKKLDKMYP